MIGWDQQLTTLWFGKGECADDPAKFNFFLHSNIRFLRSLQCKCTAELGILYYFDRIKSGNIEIHTLLFQLSIY